MAEADYFLSAILPEMSYAPLLGFIEEGQLASTYWHNRRNEMPQDFWPTFRLTFPNVVEYLQLTSDVNVETGDCDNDLAGLLDFGDEENRYEYNNGVFTWRAHVWHFADWSPLEQFLTRRFGATAIEWRSDEDAEEL